MTITLVRAADVHGDLLPGDVLLHEGRVSAVVDWGLLTTGDPAADLVPAGHLVHLPDRFLRGQDDAIVARARGWVISHAVIALPSHRDTTPVSTPCRGRALAAVLS